VRACSLFYVSYKKSILCGTRGLMSLNSTDSVDFALKNIIIDGKYHRDYVFLLCIDEPLSSGDTTWLESRL